jgi:hypothetical protein
MLVFERKIEDRHAGRKTDRRQFLVDQKSFEDRKQGLIDDLLRQRADAMKGFDDKLAKLGYQAKDGSGKPKKTTTSRHRNLRRMLLLNQRRRPDTPARGLKLLSSRPHRGSHHHRAGRKAPSSVTTHARRSAARSQDGRRSSGTR